MSVWASYKDQKISEKSTNLSPPYYKFPSQEWAELYLELRKHIEEARRILQILYDEADYTFEDLVNEADSSERIYCLYDKPSNEIRKALENIKDSEIEAGEEGESQ